MAYGLKACSCHPLRYESSRLSSVLARGVANGGAGGQTAPPDTKNWEGEKKIGKGRKRKRKGKRGEKRKRKEEKRRKKGRKEEKRERKGKKEKREEKGKEKREKKRKGRIINTVLIEI